MESAGLKRPLTDVDDEEEQVIKHHRRLGADTPSETPDEAPVVRPSPAEPLFALAATVEGLAPTAPPTHAEITDCGMNASVDFEELRTNVSEVCVFRRANNYSKDYEDSLFVPCTVLPSILSPCSLLFVKLP
jgi:hypothetical protein